jgi:hypothetical protein
VSRIKRLVVSRVLGQGGSSRCRRPLGLDIGPSGGSGASLGRGLASSRLPALSRWLPIGSMAIGSGSDAMVRVRHRLACGWWWHIWYCSVA